MEDDNRERVQAESPLMREGEYLGDGVDRVDESSRSGWYLFLLTLSIGGYVLSCFEWAFQLPCYGLELTYYVWSRLQVVWSVELSNGSVSSVYTPSLGLYNILTFFPSQPFLLSLGMSKSLLAFVWIAGPLTGTLVQPYIGIRSDNCRIPWGKRKPFMVVGSAATVVSLLALAWVKEIVGGLLSLFGADPASKGTRVMVITVATIIMFCLDFAINTGSSPCVPLC
jgi:solute carrier family 45 protein 1/2/4